MNITMTSFIAHRRVQSRLLMKLPRYQMNLKYNFGGLYWCRTKITHLDLPGKTLVKFCRWSPTSTTHYKYARRLLEDHY